MRVLAELAEQAILEAQRLEQETDELRTMRQIQKVQLLIAKAKRCHGGLLQEENETYFQKVVARTTLRKA